MAIILALLSMLLMSALGAALVLTTSAETIIAANFRRAQEGVYAADAALELAIADLAMAPDWTPVLDGSARSAFADGPPNGFRTLADGSRLDLDRIVNMLNCRKAGACSDSSLVAVTAQRPWGANNPVWRLYAYGPLSNLLPENGVDSPHYVVAMAADDPSENDGDPLRDGDRETNAGTAVLTLRAEAFGPRGVHQMVEATVVRGRAGAGPEGLRILSWRLLR